MSDVIKKMRHKLSQLCQLSYITIVSRFYYIHIVIYLIHIIILKTIGLSDDDDMCVIFFPDQTL